MESKIKFKRLPEADRVRVSKQAEYRVDCQPSNRRYLSVGSRFVMGMHVRLTVFYAKASNQLKPAFRGAQIIRVILQLAKRTGLLLKPVPFGRMV